MIIVSLWRQQPGEFFCVSTKSESGIWKDHFFSRNELQKVRPFLEKNKHQNLYFCPHGFKKPRRTKENAVLPKLLWSDMDDVHPRDIEYPPSIAIESSPDRYVGLWVLDRPGTEDLNRRMSYAIGADKSGWDLTQVLRVPGTINYKYDDHPRTRIVWRDRKSWTVKGLEEVLPEIEKEKNSFEATDAAKLYKKWESKLKHTTRRELMQSKAPMSGKRSEVFMRLAFELLEAGVPKEDGCTLLKASVWNKYAGRRDEDKQISSSWDKATNKKLSGERVVVGEDADPPPIPRADQIMPKDTHWLWYPWIPSGGLSLLGGRGGVGKGFLCADLVARVTKGGYWPESREVIEPGNVLWCESEDPSAEVLVPRLTAAGANLSRIHIVRPAHWRDHDMADFIKKNKIRLVVLSPLNSFLEGVTDTNSQAEVRAALDNLNSIVDNSDCAVLGIMHVKKGDTQFAVEKIMGSSDYVNFSRSTFMVHKEEDGLIRLFHVKYNLGVQGEDLLYSIVNRDRSRPRGQFAGIDWVKPEQGIDVDRVFERREPGTLREETKTAGDWLFSFLKHHQEASFEDIAEAAQRASHSREALKRAKARSAGRIKHRKTGPGKVVWFLSRSTVGNSAVLH